MIISVYEHPVSLSLGVGDFCRRRGRRRGEWEEEEEKKEEEILLTKYPYVVLTNITTALTNPFTDQSSIKHFPSNLSTLQGHSINL